MNKEQQIKEMTNLLDNAIENQQSEQGCFYLEKVATALYEAGYRKQSDTVREIYNKIYDNLPQTCDWSWLQGAHWAMQIAAEFGGEDEKI